MSNHSQQVLENVYRRAGAPRTLLYETILVIDVTTGETVLQKSRKGNILKTFL